MDRSTPSERLSFRWDAVVLGLVAAALVIAHFAIRRRPAGGERAGNVAYLDAWSPATYEGENLKLEPSLLAVGDSQGSMVISPVPNDWLGDGIGNTSIDELARRLDQKHPATPPRSYLRISGAAFSPLDVLMTIGVFLQRAGPRPVPVLIGLDVNMSASERVHVRTIETLGRFPEATEAVLGSFGGLPEGQRGVASVRRALANARAKRPPLIDRAEHELTGLSRAHKYYYAYPQADFGQLPYFRAEARALGMIFGRVDQAVPDPPIFPKAKEYPMLKLLLAFLSARGMPAVCYVQPRNPALYPLDKVDAYVSRLMEFAKEAGCLTVIDAFHPVRNAEDFGYFMANIDHDHLTETGHRHLGDVLFDEGEKAGVWSVLEPR